MNTAMSFLRLWYRAYRYRYKVEKNELEWMRLQISPNTTAVDVGGHKGAYAYWMSRWVRSLGKVIVFEPQKQLAEQLERIKHLRYWDHVTVEAKGVSNENGVKNFSHPSDTSSPGANFENKLDGSNWQTKPLEVVTLDSYFQEKEIPPIGFIKIDVEGHELKVLQGASEILNQHKPSLLIECESRHLKEHSVHDVFEFLKQKGYQGKFFYRNQLLPLDHFNVEKHQQHGNEDYVYNFAFHHSSYK